MCLVQTGESRLRIAWSGLILGVLTVCPVEMMRVGGFVPVKWTVRTGESRLQTGMSLSIQAKRSALMSVLE